MAISGWSWTVLTEQYCEYRLDGAPHSSENTGWIRVKQYQNGTFTLESANASSYSSVLALLGFETTVTAVIEKTDTSASPITPSPIPENTSYMGSDESGKGDYFGPLVIAGVAVTPETEKLLESMGVMDSKKLKDKQIGILAAQIRTQLGSTAISIVEVSPKRYNELYQTFKSKGQNLNHLLAWGHATVIENLLEQGNPCTWAVADQFGSEHYIKQQLKPKGKTIHLHQQHRAEAITAVAAASILARDRFVQKLQKLSAEAGSPLPPGASAAVKAAARQLVLSKGAAYLGQVAKLHFKTTLEVT
ncbi:MAG: ribonuclease HIII [Cyanobacteria bacterium]|nr:ribonuclease HIII [Cyanobacteriota bacterium]